MPIAPEFSVASPVGQKRRFLLYLNLSCLIFFRIFVSSFTMFKEGKRGRKKKRNKLRNKDKRVEKTHTGKTGRKDKRSGAERKKLGNRKTETEEETGYKCRNE
jgi:hypothetical protein